MPVPATKSTDPELQKRAQAWAENLTTLMYPCPTTVAPGPILVALIAAEVAPLMAELSTERELRTAGEESARNLARFAETPIAPNYRLPMSGCHLVVRDELVRLLRRQFEQTQESDRLEALATESAAHGCACDWEVGEPGEKTTVPTIECKYHSDRRYRMSERLKDWESACRAEKEHAAYLSTQVAYEQERNRNNVLALTAERDEALAAMSSDGADAVGANQILRSDRDSWRKLAARLAEYGDNLNDLLRAFEVWPDAESAETVARALNLWLPQRAAYDAKVKVGDHVVDSNKMVALDGTVADAKVKEKGNA
jgi:hypothetical protein